MNLAQSGILPPPSLWFVPYPFVPPPAAVPAAALPRAGSHAARTLTYLRRRHDWSSFRQIWKKIGGENSLGSSLRLLKERGFIEVDGGDKTLRYRSIQIGPKRVQ